MNFHQRFDQLIKQSLAFLTTISLPLELMNAPANMNRTTKMFVSGSGHHTERNTPKHTTSGNKTKYKQPTKKGPTSKISSFAERGLEPDI
jgi:hypothetical protein